MTLEKMKISGYKHNVKDLPNYPITKEMTPDMLKEFFDSRGDNEIKSAINGIIDTLMSEDGASQVKTGDGTSVEARLTANNDYTDAELNKLEERQNKAMSAKVDKVSGKELTTNDFTNDEKARVSAAYEHISNTDNPHKLIATQISTTLENNVDEILNEHAIKLCDMELNLGDIDLALDSILALEEHYIGGGAQ